VYEDGKQRRWRGIYGGGEDPYRVVAPVKEKARLLMLATPQSPIFYYPNNIYRKI
jgi:hypothetical protein